MGHITNVSIQIHSSISQYHVFIVSLKKMSGRYSLGGSKLTFLLLRLNRGVWFLVFGGFSVVDHSSLYKQH
jgi:hypothetical protein